MSRMTELMARYPHAPLVAVDRLGQVLAASPATPDGLRPDSAVPDRLRVAMAAAISAAGDPSPSEAPLVLHEELAILTERHAVLDGATPVGACFLLLDGGTPSAPNFRTTRPVATPTSALPPALPALSPPRERRSAPTRYTFRDLIGHGSAHVNATRVAIAAAANTLPVLLLGESGTGKEVFAQAIHAASARRERPFVAVNCAAIPHTLVESELFGYVGGAFSGARKEGSAGKFEAAHGGTIFLDEIAELPASAQAALLRVLQEGEVTRVGGLRGTPVDVRVVAATNRDLTRAMATARFRRDLFFRLDVLSVELPALRERPEDLEPLATHFLAEACVEEGRAPLALSPDVLAAFRRHAWPGNVRELKNLARRLAALVSGHVVTLADLPPALVTAGDAPPQGLWDAFERDLALEVAEHEATTPRATGAHQRAARRADDPERARTLQVVRTAHPMRDAARTLGITRSTLYRRLDRYGVHVTRAVSDD
jgi:transcriptional regulator with PAS, ATPase and Fis domain